MAPICCLPLKHSLCSWNNLSDEEEKQTQHEKSPYEQDTKEEMGLGIWAQVHNFASFYFIIGHGPSFLR